MSSCNLPVSPHILHICLKRIKFACEEMNDYDTVSYRADKLLERDFEENCFTAHDIKDIRYSLEMIVLAAHNSNKDNIVHYMNKIRKILDHIFMVYLWVFKRIKHSITPCAKTSGDIGIIEDLPQLVRYQIMNNIFDAL